MIRIVLAIVLIFLILNQTETYVPRTFLDEEWREVRNDPRRRADPFNTCSPESFGDCTKRAFPHL